MDLLNAFALLGNYVLVPAASYGCQLTLGALGVTLVYGVLRFSNFAHAELMSFTTMLGLLTIWQFQAFGVSIAPLPTALLALPIAMLGGIGIALLTDRWVYAHYRKVKARPLVLVIASIGVMLAMGGLVRLVIGSDDQQLQDGARFLFNAREFKQYTGLKEGLTLKNSQLITLIVTLIAVSGLFLFLNKTPFGKAMRAFSDNEDLALLSGINPERVVQITWIITAVMAALAGVLFGLDKSYKPFIFMQLLLPIFASAIVGGLGSPLGAIAGGFLVAFSEVTLTFAYKKFLGYLLPQSWLPEGLLQLLGTEYKFAISFLILVVVLLIRPQGIFKGKAV